MLGNDRKLEIVDFPDEDHAFQPAAVGELSIEIEMLLVGEKSKVMVVYTGDLAKIKSKHVSKSFTEKFCT